MKVVCVGGGPAGLYFAILAKLRDRDRDVTVFERNPAGVTYGWGVTFSDELLDHLYRNDPKSAQEIYNNPASWRNQEVHVGADSPFTSADMVLLSGASDCWTSWLDVPLTSVLLSTSSARSAISPSLLTPI